ncbi:hypothetical protein K2173_015066 [Erythroxylum novogranatense]|uniref:BUB1 N-terminal domain-containing protein n=1 Tax=Erythroxylum novogranatense TaxID=1862640 RepID=A0AAV8T1Z0_9ROSI|nr:hypothetical protein K2173_015066 [Erythroxylum novogranatense]
MEAEMNASNNRIRKVREEEDEGWLDPKMEFFASKRETGNEWELFKENVRLLKKCRNVQVLNQTLKSQTNNTLKYSLLYTRSKLINTIDQYEGDDPLLPWLQKRITFPPGGDCSGLIVIYEQCVRTFWHSHQYKDNLWYLKVWLEYMRIPSLSFPIFSYYCHTFHSFYYTSYQRLVDFSNGYNHLRHTNIILSIGSHSTFSLVLIPFICTETTPQFARRDEQGSPIPNARGQETSFLHMHLFIADERHGPIHVATSLRLTSLRHDNAEKDACHGEARRENREHALYAIPLRHMHY